MVYRIYVGSYSDNISTLEFDPEAPSLKIVSSIILGHHPSWVTAHPKDTSLIFTALEQADGRIIAVKFDHDGKGSIVAETPSGGADPCTLLCLESQILVGNYSSGAFVTIPVSAEAPVLTPNAATIAKFSGTGPSKERQEASHPHQIALHPDREEVLIPDLGVDKTYRLTKDEAGTWVVKGAITYAPGSGPRHVAFHNGILYTVLELTSEVTAHRLPTLPAVATFITSKTLLPNPPPLPARADMLAAEVLIPTPNATFSHPYLYASNRNDPSPEGDSIVIFSIADPEKLEIVAEVRTGLRHLRGMQFGGPDNRWLVAGGVFGQGVKIFERIDGGKGLKQIAAVDVEAPTGFLWA